MRKIENVDNKLHLGVSTNALCHFLSDFLTNLGFGMVAN